MTLLFLAANPGAEVHLQATGGSPSLAAGVSLGAGADWGPAGVYGVGQLDLGATPSIELRPEVRFRLTPDGGPGLLLLAGAGARRSEGAWTPSASVGLALALDLTPSTSLRLESRYRAVPGTVDGMQLGLVFAWSKPLELVEPEVVPVAVQPEVVPTGAGTLLMAPQIAEVATVWVPHPICRWLTVSEANVLLRSLSAGTEVRVVAPGFTPLTVAVDGDTEVALARAADTGSLVVAALPGDHILVDGVQVNSGPDGLVVLKHREGFVPIAVVGGGRVFETEVAVVRGHTLWARSSAPQPHNVRFALDSAVLSPSAGAELTLLGDNAGDWHFTVQGGASPEGSLEHNLALADRRAEAVVQALVAAGVDPDAIQQLPAEVREDGDPDALRSATITPVKP